MSAVDDLLRSKGIQPAVAAPEAEQLPDDKYLDTPEGFDADARKKHKTASQYYPIIDRYAKDYPDVPELSSYAKGVMLRESGGNPDATSSAGARGLFQMIPGTYQEMGGDPANAGDPMDNIPRGIQYLAQQYRDFGDWDQALAAYNWGPGSVARHGIDVLPHETDNYLKAVKAYKRRLQPTAVEQMFGSGQDAPATPAAGMGSAVQSLFANALKDKPSLDNFQQQGPIDINQPQPVANGMPALKPYQPVQGVEDQPAAPIPFTSVPPQMAGYTPPQKPTAQQNLQASAERQPVDVNEFGQGVVKGMVKGATAGLAHPAITERQAPAGEMGQFIGAAAPMALGPLGPEAVAAGMTSQAFLQHAKPDAEGKIANPIETTVQAVLAGTLGSLGPGNIPNMGARIGAGAGIGAVQATAGQIVDKISQLANEGEVDPYNQEDVKNLAISMLQGGVFGAHGGEGAPHGSEAGIQHPGEMAMPIPEQKSFADRTADEALHNTQTRFSPYDPEGKQEPPISVNPEAAVQPQEAPQAQAGNFDMARQSFLNEAEKHFGPEKAKVVQELLGAYLPGGKNAGKYGVRLQGVDEVTPQGAANTSDLNAKNSSSSSLHPSNDMAAKGGGGMPGTPEAMEIDPSFRTTTWTGKEPTLQNEDRSLNIQDKGVNEPMPENVTPAPEEVKAPRVWTDKTGALKQPDKIPTLKSKIHSVLRDRKIYVDDELRRQLGTSKGGARELGPILTNDKANGLTLDGVAEIIREQANNANEHYEGIGHGKDVQANDIADALFSGNQVYKKPQSTEPEHVRQTDDILRNGSDQVDGLTPTPARALGNEFETAGMMFKRVGTTDKNQIVYKDEYGGRYKFEPDDMVHTGGELKPTEAPKDQAAATTPQEDFTGLFQKGPPKTSQEDMFGNKGRTASEGFIKGKGEDKGLEGTPLFEGEKRQEQAKAEEDQQRLFQKDEEKKPAPTFYSQLRKVIEEKMPNAAGPEAIKGLAKANAVKDEEMKWSGLDDLLKTKEGQKLTKKEVLDHLDQNQIEIREVAKGAGHSKASKEQIALDEYDTPYTQLDDARQRWVDQIHAAGGRLENTEGAPKYSRYQEEGGKNYRELLLTLPDRKSEEHAKRLKEHSDKMTAAWDAKDHDLYRKLDNEYSDMHAPGKDPAYKSGHWAESNVLAHVRFNDRTTPDGKKVLHLEEVQSDWHQEGRKKGYDTPEFRDSLTDGQKKLVELERAESAALAVVATARDGAIKAIRDMDYLGFDSAGQALNAVLNHPDYAERWDVDAKHKPTLDAWLHSRAAFERAKAAKAAFLIPDPAKKLVPDAPFKKNWHEMALRRMLRYAAENGYDYVSWTGGEKQAARYDLSKHLDTVDAHKTLQGKYAIRATDKNGRVVHDGVHAAEDLPNLIGKDLADKIVAETDGKTVPGKAYEKTYSGLDLKVGGEGMTGFYDKIVPQYLSKYGKKWGAGVEKIQVGEELRAEKYNAYGDLIRQRDGKKSDPWEAQGIPITDAMRKSVVEEGQPLFQGKPEDQIKGYTDFDPAKKEFVISLVKGKADISTLFHEMFHYLEQSGIVSSADRAVLTKALEAYGIKDAVKKNGTFNEAGAEKTADWWERYLRDGKSPVPELQKLFDKVRKWMVETYRTLKGTRLEGQIPASVRKAFDNIIEGGREGADTTPDEGRLAQKAGQKPREQTVGPDAPRNQKRQTREDFMVFDAKPGEKDSGFLTRMERRLFKHGDRAYPIKKIQQIYENEFKFPVGADQDLRYAVNRIYGAAGTADHFINQNLAPAIEGGKIGDHSFERLQPAESKSLFEFLLARDALWRYDNSEGYEMPNNLPKNMALQIMREYKGLAKTDPAKFAKLEKAGNAMVDYARNLAIKKMGNGMWTPEEFQEITKNPYYIPEIRYWAKTLATGKKPGKGLEFATKMKLIRGTHATSEDVPVFDPLTSLIHDTHQLAKEGAKHFLGNTIADMQDASPELQKVMVEQEPDYKLKAHEGTFPVRRPRQTILNPEREHFAEKYQNALHTLEADENSTGTSAEDVILARQRKRFEDRIAALPPNKRRLLGETKDILDKMEVDRQKWNEKRVKDARATVDEFEKLPPEEKKIVRRWMKEGEVTNYTVPIELAEAMNSLEPIDYGTIGKILKGTTTLFKKGTVTWNPAFAAVNLIRDTQEAFGNTNTPHHYVFKGLHDYLTESPLYHIYMERGGNIGSGESGFKGATSKSTDIRHGRRLVRDRLNKLKNPDNWKGKTLKIGEKEYNIATLAKAAHALSQGGKAPAEAMEAFGHMSEIGVRLGVMRYGKEKLGMNDDQAIDMARHATLDFDQRGASLTTQIATDIVPFLNPRIQGALRTGKRLLEARQNPKKVLATMALGGLAPMLGLTAVNMLNPAYANVSDRDKRYSWVIMFPGMDKPALIPKPALVQVLFNPFQMALEKAVGTSHSSWHDQILNDMMEIMPVQDVSGFAPPLAKAVYENKVNKDLYWNRDIVKEPGREDVDQYDPRTSETMKRVAEKLQWLPDDVAWLRSPERLQHIAKTMLGGTADNLLFLTDALLNPRKALKSDRIPVVSRFYKGADEWQGELAQQQREIMKQIKMKDRSAGSSTEFMQAARAGEEVDREAVSARLHHTGAAEKDLFRQLGDVNKEIARVRDLVQAVHDHNPDVEYRFLRPPLLKSQAPQAPADASPKASP